MTKPLVTVCLNSFNRPRLIRDAIDSVLAQTWPNIQLIICDDYSNAETHDVIDEYSMRWSDVVYPPKEPSAQERQYGQRCSVCINAATPYIRGDFVCYLPDDDMLTPRSIEVRAQYLMDHPRVNAVYGRLESCVSHKPVHGFHWLGEDWQFGAAGHATFPVGSFSTGCRHDRTGFWSAEPIARAANRLDHSMPMFRRVPNLPEWPEVRTQEWFHVCGYAMRSFEVPPQETELGQPPWYYEPWASSPGGLRAAFCYTGGEEFDCPDAGFFFRCELAGVGPFHSVPEVVCIKRYHGLGHRTDPSRRE